MFDYTINTDKECYKAYNGHSCKIVNTYREDGCFEVYIEDMETFIILEPSEIDGDD